MPTAPADSRVMLVASLLRRRADELGFLVSTDGRVGERNAAQLLQMHPDSLARKRVEGTAPPAYLLGVGRARISYSLIDLAVWIESRREKIDGEAA